MMINFLKKNLLFDTVLPMPNKYLAKSTNVSIATAYRYKHEAEKSGYIETKSNCSILETTQGAKITLAAYDVILKGILKDEQPNRLRKGRYFLKWKESSLIRSCIKTKKKEYVWKGKK